MSIWGPVLVGVGVGIGIGIGIGIRREEEVRMRVIGREREGERQGYRERVVMTKQGRIGEDRIATYSAWTGSCLQGTRELQ